MTGIDGYHTDLRTETVGNLADQLWATDSCRVDTDLVGTSVQQSLDISQLVDTSAHSKWDIQRLCHSGHHIGKRLATFERCGDVKEHQFVGSLFRIGLAQFYRIACRAQIDEVSTFHGLSVLHIQTRYYAFCQSHSSFRLILPS